MRPRKKIRKTATARRGHKSQAEICAKYCRECLEEESDIQT